MNSYNSPPFDGQCDGRIRFLRIGWMVLIIGGLGLALIPAVSAGWSAQAQPAAASAKPDYRSLFLAVGFSPASPAFTYFSVDSLGGGRLAWNPVLAEAPADSPLRLKGEGEGVFVYAPAGKDAKPAWTVSVTGKKLVLRSTYIQGLGPLPFVLTLNQKSNHATLLGLIKPGERRVALPCVLHLPDMGSLKIKASLPGSTLDYDARRYVKTPFVQVAFPAATAAAPRLEYELEVAAIYPALRGLGADPRYDGYRRSFLNLFQVNPRVQMLANNASSDPVPFTLYMDALMAEAAPELVEGLTCLDLVRMTVDRYLAGAKGYGLVGYAVEPGDADLVAWKAPWNSLDTYPSLLLAACAYVAGSHDLAWGKAHFDGLSAWASAMMGSDKNGNGLIEHPHTGNFGDRATADKRPSNWWDTINFGHEDAYANALAYKACLDFAGLARSLGRPADADVYAAKAAKLKAAYQKAFYNPASGLLAGWKSADGNLHDYAFTFVNGIAVAFGLVEGPAANSLMDRLLLKMREVGFSGFRYGLPGNLVPVPKGDYVNHNWAGAREVGEPSLEDGSDAFQIYENGGATACYAYFTVKALYKLGRIADARTIFYPMLQTYAAGDFQGFCDDGRSKDWRDWKGGCHGYEGLLCDGFLALLCVADDLAAKPPSPAGK